MCANQASTVSILRNILMCARLRLIDLGLGLEIMMARNRWRRLTGVTQREDSWWNGVSSLLLRIDFERTPNAIKESLLHT